MNTIPLFSMAPLTACLLAASLAVSGCEATTLTTIRTTSNNNSLSRPPRASPCHPAGMLLCTEAIYAEMNGVDKADGIREATSIPGIAKSARAAPAMRGGRITFDPTVVTSGNSSRSLANPQPDDTESARRRCGTQYRSAIFPWMRAKWVARASMAAAEEAELWDDPIVTSIEPLAPFYVAEDYHQDYFANNPDQGYCVAVVGPKVKKFKALFADNEVCPLSGFSPSHVKAPDWINPKHWRSFEGKTVQHEEIPLFLSCPDGTRSARLVLQGARR